MSTLPTTWMETNLGAVVPYGATVKAEPEDLTADTWVLELEDIEKDTSKVLQRLTFADRQSKSTKNRFDAGDVLYGKLRPYLNKVTFADQPGVCTTEIVPIKPNDAVHGRYLFHWLRHPKFLTYVTEVSHGVNMPRLGTAAGRQAPFVLAPKEEQKRIADKLDTVLTRVDAVNTRLARVAPLLKRFRQAVLAAAMAGKLTSDWREANEAEDVPQVPIDTNEDAGSWSFSSLPASWTACRFDTCFSDETDSARKVPQANYVINGTLAVVDQGQSLISGYTNDVAMISICQPPVLVFGDHTRIVKWVDFPFAQGADGVKVLRPRLKVPKFAYILLQAITLPDKGYSRHFKYLKRSVFPVPPTEEQAEIVRRVETLFAFADRMEARLQAAQTAADRLTPSLLAKAFRGELVPQDPNDEPASELLKRLAAAGPVGKPKRGRRPTASL